MATERLVNDGVTYVALPYAAGSATLVVADASQVPDLSGGGQCHAICYTPGNAANKEILLVTAADGATLTVTPAAEAFAGLPQASRDHPAGDVVAFALTAGALARLLADAVEAHEAAADPHPQYLRQAEADALYMPAGSPGGSPFAWNETPAGALDGVNALFTLAHGPDPPASLSLHLNGLLQRAGPGDDYTLSGNALTMAQPPGPDDTLTASYAY